MAEVEIVSDKPCDMNPNSANPCFTSEEIGAEHDLRNYFDERQGNRGLSAGRPQCRFTRTTG